MPVFEMRVALTVDDFEAISAFYRDGLGLDAGDLWTDMGNGQLFFAGRATLEVFDPAHAAGVDALEVGAHISGPVRLAFQVPDVHAAIESALRYGATLVHGPVLTPWNDLNARISAPNGMQITLFQPMNPS